MGTQHPPNLRERVSLQNLMQSPINNDCHPKLSIGCQRQSCVVRMKYAEWCADCALRHRMYALYPNAIVPVAVGSGVKHIAIRRPSHGAVNSGDPSGFWNRSVAHSRHVRTQALLSDLHETEPLVVGRKSGSSDPATRREQVALNGVQPEDWGRRVQQFSSKK